MKKFVLVHYGFVPPTPEIGEAWVKWFEEVGGHMVDSGNPLGSGREISREGIKELPLGLDSLTGYSIINAENMDEATKIAQSCPFITSIRVYEAMSM